MNPFIYPYFQYVVVSQNLRAAARAHLPVSAARNARSRTCRPKQTITGWIVLTVLFFFGSNFYPGVQAANGAAPRPITVVIDPGHGGRDPGAVYRNIREKDIVLDIGLRLGKLINQHYPEVKVLYTRKTDVFIPLHERADLANKHKADLFISLHVNASGTSSVSGTETFVLGLHRSQENLEVAKKENSVILLEDDYKTTYEGFDPNSSESYIMFANAQSEYFDQSVMFASEIQSQFRNIGRVD